MLAMQSHVAIADDTTAQATPGAPAADPDAWRFRAVSYGWLMNVSGNVTARGRTVDVDASFIQLIQKSDSLIGFMGYFEADKGPVGFYTDIVWAKLGFDKSVARARNPIAGLNISATANATVDYSMVIVEAGGLYELAHWPGSPGSFTALDGLLGFRYWNNTIDANVNLAGSIDLSRLGVERSRSFGVARSGSVDWVDPVVGLRLRHQFTPSQEVFIRGDVGGFGFQNRFEWQAVGAYSYAWQFTGYQLAAAIGYRALGVDSSSGSGINATSANVVLHGPIIGFSIRF
jgi:hypothetical protein